MRFSYKKNFTQHKRTLAALLFCLAFSVTVTYAVPPGSPYTAGETLDPACAPGDTNCTVEATDTSIYVGDGSIPAFESRTVELLENAGLTFIASANPGIDSISSYHDGSQYSIKYQNTNSAYTEIRLGSTISLDTYDENGEGVQLYFDYDGAMFIDENPSPEGIKYNDDYSATFTDRSLVDKGYVDGALLIGSTSSLNSETWLGEDAGAGGASDNHTIFIGIGAGQNATDASESLFIGTDAGTSAINAITSNFIGYAAGYQATSAFGSNFIGTNAGVNATGASQSNFVGEQAGFGATNAFYSNFIGWNAGNEADEATYSNFIGYQAGDSATNAGDSVFIGHIAGYQATNAPYSNFIGSYSGNEATNAQLSNFIGYQAGSGATNAAGSIFIGTNAGLDDTVDNTASGYSILIGPNSSTGGFSGSIVLGSATNTMANQFKIDSSITNFSLAGVDYVFPSSVGAAGTVLTDVAGDGTLTWEVGGGGTPAITIENTSSLFSTGLSGTGDGSTALDSVFLGIDAGDSAIDAYESNFLGKGAGQDAADAHNANFFGTNAGNGAFNAAYSNFFNEGAGQDATDAAFSNFMGLNAGFGATNAANANFFGQDAGNGATDALQSNFIGNGAGYQATNSTQANFIGANAGFNATDASLSNFIGYDAGREAANAQYSNFIGQGAGYGATNASNSIFIGQNAGLNDTVDNTSDTQFSSILIGYNTSTGGFSNSIAIGNGAENTDENQYTISTDITNFRFVGVDYVFPSALGAAGSVLTDVAGDGTLTWENPLTPSIIVANGGLFSTGLTGAGANSAANESIFFGVDAGGDATNASNSNFLGYQSGYQATDATNGNFFGFFAGRSAANASNSNFFGSQAGQLAANASNSNFFGSSAGRSATNADNSNFFGPNAGFSAPNAAFSNFFGYSAGINADDASNSIFIGQSAGSSDQVDNTGDVDNFSILIGKDTSTGGFENSIAIGGSATNTASNQFMLGSTTRPITQFVINGTNPSLIGGTTSGNNLTVTSTSNATKGKILLGTLSAYDEVNDYFGIGQTTPTSKLDITTNSLGVTQTNTSGIVLANNTAAAAGAQQISPGLRFRGNGWKTDATAASQTVDWRIDLLPIQGTAAPTSSINFSHSTNGGAYTSPMSLLSSGSVTFLGQVTATNGIFSSVLATNATSANANFETFSITAGLTTAQALNGSTNTQSRVRIGGASSTVLTANNSHANLFVQGTSITEGTSGTHPLLASFAARPLAITNGTATTTAAATIYIESAATGTTPTNNYAFWSAAGDNRFGGNVAIGMDLPSVALDVTGDIEYTGSITDVSDERLKENITDFDGGLAIVNAIGVKNYNMIASPDRGETGFIAQNVNEHFPEAVSVVDPVHGYMGVSYVSFIPVLTKAVQELDIKVQSLASLDTSNELSLGSLVREFLADIGNGISDIYGNIIHSDRIETNTLCVGNTCITEAQFLQMVQANQLVEDEEEDTDSSTDICPNIDGVQSDIPNGYHLDSENNCVLDIVVDPDPTLDPDPLPDTPPAPDPELSEGEDTSASEPTDTGSDDTSGGETE